MTTLVHLSDLHFGSVEPDVIAPLRSSILEICPDLVAVSGDLTQRARRAQYKAAREFLDSLPFPKIIVPGNHDVPLYDVARRFFSPLGRYRRYISPDTEPTCIGEDIAVIGVNSARSATFQSGRINDRQLARVQDFFSGVTDEFTRIVVCHHPFDMPPGRPHGRVRGAGRIISSLASAGAELVLSGHFHLSHVGHAIEQIGANGRLLLLIHSGTATSNRRRGEANAFNCLRINRPAMEITRYWWNVEENRFVSVLREDFERSRSGWAAAPASKRA